MKELEYLYFEEEQSFRSWLDRNHDKSPGIWLVIYKKHTARSTVSHPEALDLALCYGWIDSIIKKMDDDRYAIKFTPRTDIFKWSDYNLRRVDELIRSGKMTAAGLRKIDASLLSEDGSKITDLPEKKKNAPLVIPDFITSEFAANEPALTNFNRLSLSCRRQYILWITDARKAETQMKRVTEAITLLKEGKKLTLK